MTKSNYFKVILIICATIIFINVILGGQQFISTKVPAFWAFVIEFLCRVSQCIIYYSFFKFLKYNSDKLQLTLTKVLLFGKTYLTFSLLLNWTETSIIPFLEGIVYFLIFLIDIIWSCRLFLKFENKNKTFKTVRLYATFNLISLVCSFAILSNLIHSIDINSNMTSSKTIMFWIPQFIFSLPNLILFVFASRYGQDMETEMANT